MIITCLKSELINGINIVSKAVPAKTTLSIQECILIDASGTRIYMTANDMEIGIETEISGNVEEKGSAAIDAKIFSDIIRKLPDSEVYIRADNDQNVTISCEKAKFKIMSRDWEEFSRIPAVEQNDPVQITQMTLKSMIQQTIFSVAQNDPNRIMTGEYMEIRDNTLRLISLDGHRISVRKVIMKDHYPDSSVIIPGKTMLEISRILNGDADSIVEIYISKNHIMFFFDQTTVVSRLIEGEYFRVDRMITRDYETKISINRKDLMDCLERAILLIREEDRKPVILDIKDNQVALKVNTHLGSLDENIETDMEGRDIMIGFNPKYFLDAIRAVEDEIINIYFMNSKSPCFIRNEEESYIYLVLPVNFIV